MKKIIENKVFRWGLGIFGVIFAMYICANASYYITKKRAPLQDSKDADTFQEGTEVKEDKPFPNLPVNTSGVYSENLNFESPDMNDYLVVSEGALVNLYSITKEGTKIFEQVLDIDLSSLKSEDKTLLLNGILLDTKDDVLSLIEDYSS